MSFLKSLSILFFLLAVAGLCLPGCHAIQTRHDTNYSQNDNYLSLGQDQKSAFSYFCTGYFYLLERKWEKAAKNFENANKRDPSSERIVKHLATCYFQLGEKIKAINLLEKLSKKKPQEFSIHYTLATLYEMVEEKEQAIVSYEHASQCKINNLDYVFYADSLYRLANLYMDQGQIEKGAEYYKRMFDMNLVGQPAKIHYEIGKKYFEKKMIDKALEHFLKSKKYNPQIKFTSFYITLCYGTLKKYDEAIKEAKLFLQKEPDSWAIRLTLSEIYEETGKDSEKKNELKKIEKILRNNIKRGSKNPREYFLLCQIYRNQRKPEKAISVIENLKSLPLQEKSNKEIHFLLANLYYECKKNDKVEKELRLALKLDPDFHEANNFLGYFLLENNKNIDLAIKLINRALESQPKNGAYLDSLGWAYYKKAQLGGETDYLAIALKKLKEAVKVLEDPEIYEHLGLTKDRVVEEAKLLMSLT